MTGGEFEKQVQVRIEHLSDEMERSLGRISLALMRMQSSHDNLRQLQPGLATVFGELLDATSAADEMRSELITAQTGLKHRTVECITSINTSADRVADQHSSHLTTALMRLQETNNALDDAANQIKEIEQTRDRATERLQEITGRGYIDAATRQMIFELGGGHCFYCDHRLVINGPEPSDGSARCMHIDHIVPKTAGGPDHFTNLIPACGPCNIAKGNSPYLTFIRSRHPRLRLRLVSSNGDAS